MKPYFQDEFVTIYHGDSLEVLPQLNQKFNLCLTSPPYNFSKSNGDGCKYINFKDNSSQSEYFEFQKNIIQLMIDYCDLSLYNIQFIAGNKIALMQLMGHFAEKIKEILIWDKLNGEPAIQEKVCNSCFEFILCFGEGGRLIKQAQFARGTYNNIIRTGKNTGNNINIHAARMPINLPLNLITNFSAVGDLILDPFGGTGTTARAAKDIGRKCILIEKEEEYCEISASLCRQDVLF